MVHNKSKKNKPTICLNMIVKNEAHIIAETLESIQRYIDYWVISDTGSTDGTQDLIKKFFAKHGIEGELVEHEWNGFGHNRTKAFEVAYNKTDYVWVIDADDLVVGDIVFPKKMRADHYMLKFQDAGGNFTYERYQIFNNRIRWCYMGVLHEYPKCLDKERPKIDPINNTLAGNYFIQSRRLGARSKDPEKYVKDARILTQAYYEEVAKKQVREKMDLVLGQKIPVTDDSHILLPRYCFYAAQSYKDCGDIENAIKFYRTRTDLGGYIEEIYYSYLQVGGLLQRLENPSEKEIVEAYTKAHDTLNTRSESFYYLGMYYWRKSEFGKAYISLKIISTKPFPDSHTFFIDTAIHKWKGKYKFAKICVMLNKLKEAKDILENLLENAEYRKLIKIKRLFNKCAYTNMDELRELYDACRNKPFDQISHPLVQYNPQMVQTITEKIKSKNERDHQVTLTITSCKRLDLFKKTMNSFINCCQDISLIDRFICVDDNSSEADKTEMESLYPFFEFIFKTPEQKGHLSSMNIIMEQVKTPYLLHMEDDFLFIDRAPYIGPAVQILNQKKITALDEIPANQNIKSKEIGQVLFTRNYQEELDRYIPGGYLAITATNPIIKYVIHEHYAANTAEYYDVVRGYGSANVYWPHFSFRPSILKTDVYKKLGKFKTLSANNLHFERVYANMYNENNYISTYFDKVTCLHIGKLTHETNRQNAYKMNNEQGYQSEPVKKIVEIEGYQFYPDLDSFGHDICHHEGKTILELKVIADSLPDCQGFNTWGYIKNEICPEKDFIKLRNRYYCPDGLYVKKKSSQNVHVDNEQSPVAVNVNTAHEKLCVNLVRRPDRENEIPMDANKFEYHAKLDSHGYDIKFIGRKPVSELMKLCINDPNCLAFNTLGFLKYHVGNLKESIYFGPSDGLYIYNERCEQKKNE